jgi:hypothetical protein
MHCSYNYNKRAINAHDAIKIVHDATDAIFREFPEDGVSEPKHVEIILCDVWFQSTYVYLLLVYYNGEVVWKIKLVKRWNFRETNACGLLKLFMYWAKNYVKVSTLRYSHRWLPVTHNTWDFKATEPHLKRWKLCWNICCKSFHFEILAQASRMGGGGVLGHCNYIMLSEAARPASCRSNYSCCRVRERRRNWSLHRL